MGIFEELEGAIAREPGLCKVGMFLASIDKKDAADIEAAFQSGKYPSAAIRRVMSARGFTGGDSVVYKHGRKVCCCVG